MVTLNLNSLLTHFETILFLCLIVLKSETLLHIFATYFWGMTLVLYLYQCMPRYHCFLPQHNCPGNLISSHSTLHAHELLSYNPHISLPWTLPRRTPSSSYTAPCTPLSLPWYTPPPSLSWFFRPVTSGLRVDCLNPSLNFLSLSP